MVLNLHKKDESFTVRQLSLFQDELFCLPLVFYCLEKSSSQGREVPDRKDLIVRQVQAGRYLL